MRVLHQGRNLNCIKIPPPNFDLGSEASLTIKGKWEQDALQPGIRLFLESQHQNVADMDGLRFWSRRIAKHPGVTAILVPDSNTMEDSTPLWHSNQTQVAAGRPPARHQVVSGVAPSRSC